MNIKKIFLAACIASAVVSVPASAGVLGVADLAITGLSLVTATNSAGVPVGAPIVGGVNITGDQRVGTAGASFNGVDAIGAGNNTITTNFGAGDSSNRSVDVKYRCAGPDCGAAAALYTGTQAVGSTDAQPENNLHTHIPVPTLNYALGDMTISGSAVSGPGANGLTRADSSVAGATNIGGASGNISNTVHASTTTTFNLLPSGGVDNAVEAQFKLDYDVFRKVYIDPNNSANSSGIASASTQFILTLTSNDPLFGRLTFQPDALNDAYSAFSSAENFTYSEIGSAYSDIRTLRSGYTYTLTVTQNSLSSASEVPEPASVLLIGLSLLGLGVARHRRG